MQGRRIPLPCPSGGCEDAHHEGVDCRRGLTELLAQRRAEAAEAKAAAEAEAKAAEAEALISLLRLPHDFHVLPRNFLVLHKEAEAAFDAEALLLFPARTPTLSAASRLFRTERITGATPAETAAKRARLNGFARRRLFLPLAGEGHVPFMRLLAWKAVSALRAHEEEDEAGLGANPPVDLDMNATTTTRDDGVVVAAVQRLRMAGFRFRTVE